MTIPTETTNGGIFRYASMTSVPCGATTTLFGVVLACEKPLNHDGDHGNGPFMEYATTWPRIIRRDTQEKG